MHPFDPIREARGVVLAYLAACLIGLGLMLPALMAADRHYEVRDARFQEHFIAEPRSAVTAWRGL